MALIQRIRIQNFRSIIDDTIEFDNFNCFVGKNDSGKSNVLKALNLFFNGMTDFNTELDFENDYSKYAKKGAHQAKEIIISVDINVPETFKENGIKTWKKVWRSEGIHSDNLKTIFSGKTKAVTFFSRITYLYIPAVKSSEYFKSLLSQVYTSMTKTADSTLRTLNDRYSEQLRHLTTELTQDLKNVLKMDSSIQMPQDLNVLFRDFTFLTNDKTVEGIDLNHRGDGIKARHIPSILRYIQRNIEKYRAKNAIVYSYVWGYEEPENGIEFLSCYEMAQELYSYSEDCQLLVTTHSPAFYSLNNEINTKCFYVSKSSKGNSQYDMTYEADEIDRKIGLMPLVTPYITSEHDKFLKERIVLEEKIQEIELKYRQMSGKIILITEGKTDKKHIENAFQYLNLDGGFLERLAYYDFQEKDILGEELFKLLDKLSHINNNSIIIGLFDRDKTIFGEKGKTYASLGNNVFKTNIPALDNLERSLDDKICIEHYYSNREIKTETDGGHLYMGEDFNKFGVSTDQNWCFQNKEKNKGIRDITIVDSGCNHLQRISESAKIISKNDFADYVISHPMEFDFTNYRLIYLLIEQIVNENSNGANE